MSVGTAYGERTAGELLRQWRVRRRLSQLELSSQAEVSTRHLSFVETGRSRPSRELVLHLSEQLDLPLRERNRILLAAGFAPLYPETPLAAPPMVAMRAAVRQVLDGHDPYPAAVVDGRWDLIDANASLSLFTDLVAPELLTPPANVLRASLHPDGMSGAIVNLGEWRAHLLGRLRRQTEYSADPQLRQLYQELVGYPCEQPEPDPHRPGPADVVVPLRLRYEGGELSFFSTVTTFGTPLDLTLAELVIESFFPADAHTAQVLAGRSGGHPTGRFDIGLTT